MRKAAPKKKAVAPQPAPKPQEPSIDTKVAELAVEAAQSAQDSVRAIAGMISAATDSAVATKADIQALKESVDRLTEAFLMPTRLDVGRDNRGTISQIDVHRLRKKVH